MFNYILVHKGTNIKDEQKMKEIPEHLLKKLKETNKARTDIGLKPKQIEIRKCLLCFNEFFSLGKRTCGCDFDGELKKLEDKFNPRGKQ
jgi:hypothetical protein